MPYTVNIPIERYTIRQYEQRQHIESNQRYSRPQTERTYSTVAYGTSNSIAYFNNQNRLSRNHKISPKTNQYETFQPNHLGISQNDSNIYFNPKTRIPPKKLPPLPPKPTNRMSNSISTNERQKMLAPNLTPINDVEFVHRQQLTTKQIPYKSDAIFSVENNKNKKIPGKRQFIIGSVILSLSLAMFSTYDQTINSSNLIFCL